jgi:hypothetical protein
MKAIAYILLLSSIAYITAAAPIVVLPERFKDTEIVVKNSSVFKALVQKNKKLATQLQSEEKTRQAFENRVGTDMQSAAAELEKLRAANATAKKGMFSGITSTVLGLLNIGTQFFLNPFGYLMRTLTGIVEALIAVVVIFFGIKFAYRLYTKHKTQKQQ